MFFEYENGILLYMLYINIVLLRDEGKFKVNIDI